MTNNLPKYDRPPIVETVLGVQFAPLPGFTAAHAGWFWRQCMGEEWPTVVEASRIPDAFERFGDDQKWTLRNRLHVSQEIPSPRIQFISQDDERMVQIQNTRFHYNWRKREAHYPSYENSIKVFEAMWDKFVEFCSESQLCRPVPNQWEVTYINHIPREGLWSTVSDWIRVFPELFIPASRIEYIAIDDLNATWRLTIDDKLGRLYVNLQHIRIGGPDGPEAIGLTLTARGPISVEAGMSLRSGLDLGHSAIVRTFTDITSEPAHKHWGMKK